MRTLGISRFGVLRRLLSRLLRRREPVPAGGGPRRRPDEGGSAGVREPRRPRPHGPQGGAAARELPREDQRVELPDSRR